MSKRSAKKPDKAKASSVARAAPSRADKRNGGTGHKTKAAASRKASEKKAVEKQIVVKQKVAGKKMTARAKSSSIVLPPDYRPSEDEPFMNERQRMYFRQKLLAWKDEIIRQTRETLVGLHEESTQHADLADRATSETDRALELRARDRQRKLVAKIDAALARIEDGSYGYCEETGEPIGLKRLDARPIATLSVEAQERHERRERVYRED
jgi:DnaK suppressor protein